MSQYGHPRYPNPHPLVQEAIEFNRRFGSVIVRRGSRWESTGILVSLTDMGRTGDGRRMVRVGLDIGNYVATGAAVYNYNEAMIGYRLRVMWRRGEAHNFVTPQVPVLVEPPPPGIKPQSLSWAEWHQVCRLGLWPPLPAASCPDQPETPRRAEQQDFLEPEGRWDV